MGNKNGRWMKRLLALFLVMLFSGLRKADEALYAGSGYDVRVNH